ncbi:hypothetical protein KGM_208282 [Danaus plexippus plexippus]|uniref:FLYWCH-type domain-containing protein n=1 Tax=Danaus plexippus plexippus TaxID=278856 RepID=A0A212EXR9_DANPL|nr:hypothetical protein KGM_208282 [Danaus plexippus plexippus]
MFTNISGYEVMRLQNGRTVVMYQEHTFSYQGGNNGSFKYLYCSRKQSAKCSARLKLSKDDKLDYLKTDRGLLPYFRRHTFSFVGNKRRHLCCSKKKSGGCNAKLTINDKGYFIKGFLEHNHQPPEYHKTKDDKITYLPTQRGEVPFFRNYSYSFVNGKKYLRCSKRTRGSCKARITLDATIEYEILPSSKGRKQLILVQGYSFSIQGGNQNSYYCSRKRIAGCKARVRLQDAFITKSYLHHNHPPPSLEFDRNDYNYTILPMCGNKSAIMFENYTYSYHVRGGRTLQCSKKLSMQCGAYLKVDKNNRIIYANTNHTHEPPYYNSDFLKPLVAGVFCTYERVSTKCRAKVKMEPTNTEIIFSFLKHNHPPKNNYFELPVYYPILGGRSGYKSGVFGLVQDIKRHVKSDSDSEPSNTSYGVVPQYRKRQAINRKQYPEVIATIKKRKRNPMCHVIPSAFVTTTLGDVLRPREESSLLMARSESAELIPPAYNTLDLGGRSGYKSGVFGLAQDIKRHVKSDSDSEPSNISYGVVPQYRKRQAINRKQYPEVIATIKKRKRNPMCHVIPSAFVTTTLGDVLRPREESSLLMARSESAELIPPAYNTLDLGDLKFEVIRVSKVKRPLLLVQNYTFAQTTSDFRYWNCSRKSRKCGARLRFDNHGRLVFSSLDHNHVAPLYYKQPNDMKYEFIASTRGGQLLMINDYTFSRINKTCYVWCCSAKSSQCRARVRLSADNVITDFILEHNHPPPKYYKTNNDRLTYITKPNGTVLLMLQGYTFFRASKQSYVWLCSRYKSQCKAKVRLLANDQLTVCNDYHNHDPPKYIKSGYDYEMSTSRRGKDRIVYKGFTYSSKQNNKYWYCSTLNTCKAKLHLDHSLKIIGAFTDHNHPPPSLVRLRNGQLILR